MSPAPRQEVLAPAASKQHIRAVRRGGYWWHTLLLGEQTIVLGCIGKVGHCLNMGHSRLTAEVVD